MDPYIHNLSLQIPDRTHIIYASGHTLRMLELRVDRYRPELDTTMRKMGVRGYLWGVEFRVTSKISHNVFQCCDGDNNLLHEIDLRVYGTAGEEACK